MNNNFINPDNSKGFLYLKEIQEKNGQHGGPWNGEGGIIDIRNEGYFIDIGLQVCRFLYDKPLFRGLR